VTVISGFFRITFAALQTTLASMANVYSDVARHDLKILPCPSFG
jgi:hypothetical protein